VWFRRNDSSLYALYLVQILRVKYCLLSVENDHLCPVFVLNDDVILVACWMWRWRTRWSPRGRQVLRRCLYMNCSYPIVLLVWLHPSRVYHGGQCCMYVATASTVRPWDQSHSFLGMFAALWKATISFSVVFPKAWNNSAATGRISVNFDIWGFFENLSREFVSLKSDKNGGCFTRKQCTQSITLRIWEWETFLDRSFREYQNTFYRKFFFSKILPFCR